MRQISSDPAQISRAEQRKKRLLEIEKEQQDEDAEALKTTEEQLQTLQRSFSSVKVEFSDLDGLRWTRSALLKRQYRGPTGWFPARSTAQHSPVVLTNAELGNFSLDETIRVSFSRKPHLKTITFYDASILKPTSPLGGVQRRRRDGTRERSPIKGLFQSISEDVHCNNGRKVPISKPSELKDYGFTDVVEVNDIFWDSSPTQEQPRCLPPGLPLGKSSPAPLEI